MSERSSEDQRSLSLKGLGLSGWVAIAVLGAILIAAMAYAIHTWNALSGVRMSLAGWIFMSLGIVVTLLVGGGLMGLIFYSSRRNYDI